MTRLIRQHRFFLIALVAFLTELALLTAWRNHFGHQASALFFFFASLLCGAVGLWLSFCQQELPLTNGQADEKQAYRHSKTIRGLLFFIPLVLFSVLAYQKLHHLFLQHPVSVEQSDIIPQTQVLVQRLLQHQFPYQPISFGAYELFPTYQPLQWLPFAIAEGLTIDYRRFAFFLLLIALFSFTIFVFRKKHSPAQLFLLVPLSFLPLLAATAYEPFIFTRTLETLIAAYYLLLCLALFSRSAIVMAAAVVLCLLSRYSVVLWIPLFLFMLFVTGKRKEAATVLAICTLGVLLIYVLPFLTQDSTIFLKGYQYHSLAALAEWQGQAWQQAGEKPFQLFRGIGFAGTFYDWHPGNTAEKLKAFQLLHGLVCAVTVLLLGGLFYYRRKQASLSIFALASLKIYLAVFYHFIQIPYDYLYLTLVYVSVPIVWVTATFNSRKVSTIKRPTSS